MFSLVKEISFLDASSPCGAWYERVPSLSNTADLPSRGEYDAAARMIDGESQRRYTHSFRCHVSLESSLI